MPKERRAYYIEGERFTPSQFRRLSRARQIEAMVEWFGARFVDPVHNTSYNTREGGYLWNHGGPHDADDEIQNEFSDVAEFETMQDAVNEVTSDGTYEWASALNPYAEDDYALEEALPEERFEAAESAGGSAQSKDDRELREELVGRLDHLEKALKAYSEWRHQRGHNHPPELVEDEPLTQVDLDQAFSAVEQLREEADKEEPDTEIIIAASSSLGSFSGRLKSAAVFLGLAAVAGPVGMNRPGFAGGRLV